MPQVRYNRGSIQTVSIGYQIGHTFLEKEFWYLDINHIEASFGEAFILEFALRVYGS